MKRWMFITVLAVSACDATTYVSQEKECANACAVGGGRMTARDFFGGCKCDYAPKPCAKEPQ